MIVGTKFDPNDGENRGCHPPKKSTVVMAVMVTMLAYSAMKNAANFMLLYSVWKPATSSFSASGRSKGTRFVSAKPAIIKRTKAKICQNGAWMIDHCGMTSK